MDAQCDITIDTVDLHADLPAPDGPISNNFRVGKESSDDMFAEAKNMQWMLRLQILQSKRIVGVRSGEKENLVGGYRQMR